MQPGRLLGLDIGVRRIGVAISDPLAFSARPLTCIHRTGQGDEVRELIRLIHQHEVCGLVVGLPRHLDGRESEMAAAIRVFAGRLAAECGIPVFWAEERLSSKEAELLMAELKVPPEQRRRRRDEIAAALILKWYLESR